MSDASETFFTVVGCMDGRVQKVVYDYGACLYGAVYPDTITWPGAVGVLGENPSNEMLESFKSKIMISIDKHGSKGIVVDGHQECAGDPVSDEIQLEHIKKSVEVVKGLIGEKIPVSGVFVKRSEEDKSKWIVKEIVSAKMLA